MRVFQIVAFILFLSFFVNAQMIISLKGTVYDPNGAVILGAKVKAINGSSRVFEASVSDIGEYNLELPYTQYDSSAGFRISRYLIRVEAENFQTFEIKDFGIVPSYKREISLDFALDLQETVDIIEMPAKAKNN